MNRCDITELHFISPIANVPSIMQHGILSHNRVCRLTHTSVAMPEIQELRRNKRIPGAGNLHDYANLYFDAHNPMLSKVRARNDEICVLRIDPRIMDLPGVIISDRNAAGRWARFYPVAAGVGEINRDRIFARYWTHQQDPTDEVRHKLEKCAEVLVPDCVPRRFIIGSYVANRAAMELFRRLNIVLPVVVKSDIFF